MTALPRPNGGFIIMTRLFTAVTVALLPFIGTSLGALAVFFVKSGLNHRLKPVLSGLSAGIMTAASVFSLLLPAIEWSAGRALPAVSGFLFGVFSMLLLDKALPRLTHAAHDRTDLLVLAVTLHNLPEGMAVGVALSAYLAGSPFMGAAAALALSLGVAVQNVPEGAIVSLPLSARGMTRRRAFLWGVLSGAVEPLGALFTLWLVSFVTALLPCILALAAGAMIYVVVRELIPESLEGGAGAWGTAAFSLGFALMMLLDVTL